MSEGRRTLKEEISIDITKGTETFHILKTSLNESAGDTIYDFKKGNICLYSLNKILWVGKGGEVLNSFFKTREGTLKNLRTSRKELRTYLPVL